MALVIDYDIRAKLPPFCQLSLKRKIKFLRLRCLFGDVQDSLKNFNLSGLFLLPIGVLGETKGTPQNLILYFIQFNSGQTNLYTFYYVYLIAYLFLVILLFLFIYVYLYIFIYLCLFIYFYLSMFIYIFYLSTWIYSFYYSIIIYLFIFCTISAINYHSHKYFF